MGTVQAGVTAIEPLWEDDDIAHVRLRDQCNPLHGSKVPGPRQPDTHTVA